MKFSLVAATLSLSCGLSSAQFELPSKYIRLSTTEWPPYTGLLLPREGLSTGITSVIAKTAGYRLLTTTQDWTKAVEMGQKDPNIDGYFPTYSNQQRLKDCYLSQPIGASVLVLATLKSKPISWSSITDLSVYRLGVVDGYSNGTAVDLEVKENRQPVDVVLSDAANVTKLLENKVPGILIDRNVLAYTLARQGKSDQVVFNPNPISILPLHICFKRTPAALEIRNAVDSALKNNDIEKLEIEYLKIFSRVVVK